MHFLVLIRNDTRQSVGQTVTVYNTTASKTNRRDSQMFFRFMAYTLFSAFQTLAGAVPQLSAFVSQLHVAPISYFCSRVQTRHISKFVCIQTSCRTLVIFQYKYSTHPIRIVMQVWIGTRCFEKHFIFSASSSFVLWRLKLTVSASLSTAGEDVDEFWAITVCPPSLSPFGGGWFTCSPCISSIAQLWVCSSLPSSISWALWAVFDTEETRSDE